ncbi:MAG: hypothetical protein K6G33_04340 [Ruminococcus sp.]|uniref:hypothetical protein n=1 Tax=Ruminococcus sp. TaxID=41978 RepID=UPI0025CCBB0A|nr:hypothetical protein [Ruminococcus sp.]MCR5599955.1 hypothetical protein [Ruminococcus sp.]
MKKLVSSLIACTVVACSLFSCGNSSESKSDEKETKKKESAADLVVGKWAMTDLNAEGIDAGGIIFSADGKGSIFEDTSSMLHFVDDGLNVGGTTLSTEYFKEEGDNLTIDVMGQEMLVMKKVEAKDGYDGKYSLNGGILYDSILSGLEGRGLDEKTNIDISINFDKENSEVVFNDLFSYSVDGSKMTITGFSGFLDSDKDEVSAEFTVVDDKLTIKDSDKETVLTKVK